MGKAICLKWLWAEPSEICCFLFFLSSLLKTRLRGIKIRGIALWRSVSGELYWDMMIMTKGWKLCEEQCVDWKTWFIFNRVSAGSQNIKIDKWMFEKLRPLKGIKSLNPRYYILFKLCPKSLTPKSMHEYIYFPPHIINNNVLGQRVT